MLATLDEFTRTTTEDRQALLRAYLPPAAAHNFILGAELALLESEAPRVAAAGPAETVKPKTTQNALEQKISLSFAKDTLEHCLQLLATEIGVEIVILGSDLQLEGITRNQSFELNERDKPAGEILRAVLAKANPEGKLIYVIKAKAPGQPEAIFVTTRAAAAKRGEQLPPEFRSS